ncbi:TIGR02147 family protein [Bdellovibrio sp. HCB274]|uniref:TIGR02147 family protein n=1 Tax=Bdellovibrio sp. HCB274 TaxID=3394361 RepID=UPI0039B64BDC
MTAMTYRQLLKQELDARISDNDQYSMRAMAKQLKISSAMLSSILSGKRNLSAKRALEMAKSLKFNKKRTDYFLALVQYDTVKSDEARAELLETIFSLAPREKPEQLDIDIFNLISDWHHVAIMKMTNTTLNTLDAKTIAQHLDIDTTKAVEALDRLFRLGLLVKDENGAVKSAKAQLLANAPKHEALRKFHRQMMEKAITSLETQTSQEKFVGSETLAFDELDLEKARDIMEECFSKIIRLAAARPEKKHVYHMGIQLFRVTKDLQK